MFDEFVLSHKRNSDDPRIIKLRFYFCAYFFENNRELLVEDLLRIYIYHDFSSGLHNMYCFDAFNVHNEIFKFSHFFYKKISCIKSCSRSRGRNSISCCYNPRNEMSHRCFIVMGCSSINNSIMHTKFS